MREEGKEGGREREGEREHCRHMHFFPVLEMSVVTVNSGSESIC